MAAACAKIRNLLISTERVILWHLGYRNPPSAHCYAIANTKNEYTPATFSFQEFFKDAFLWAVPKQRRTIERRRLRRFGGLNGYYKMIVAKTNIIVCVECGNNKEAGRLCPTCYSKVKLETQAMQDAIQKELKLDPVDKEVVVVYDGEQLEKPNEFWKGKRIIEMKKSRPSWFSKNVLQGTTQAPATTTAIEPKDLA